MQERDGVVLRKGTEEILHGAVLECFSRSVSFEKQRVVLVLVDEGWMRKSDAPRGGERMFLED